MVKDLGLSTAKVEAAFEAVKPERRAQDGTMDGRDAFLAALAKELGVTQEKLAAAVGAVGGPGHGPAVPAAAVRTVPTVTVTVPAAPTASAPAALTSAPAVAAPATVATFSTPPTLAKALGVEEAKVTEALTAYRAADRKEREARRATFVKKLGVSEAEVSEVLGRFGPGPGPGPGRP